MQLVRSGRFSGLLLIRGFRVRAPDAPPILTCGFSPEHDLESQQSWNDHSFHDWLSARSLTADRGDAERLPAVTAIAITVDRRSHLNVATELKRHRTGSPNTGYAG